MDLLHDEFSMDLNGMTLQQYFADVCSQSGDQFISDLHLNEVFSLDIQANPKDPSASDIYFNKQKKGPKVCIEIGGKREFAITELNGDPDVFNKVKGKFMV